MSQPAHRILAAATAALLVACRVALPTSAAPETAVSLVDGHVGYGPIALDMDVATVERLIGQQLRLAPSDNDICPGVSGTARVGPVVVNLLFRDEAGRRVLIGIAVPLPAGRALDEVVAALERQVPAMVLQPPDPLDTPSTRKALLSLRTDRSQMILANTSALAAPVGLWITRGCVD